jgi:hypothetical protein
VSAPLSAATHVQWEEESRSVSATGALLARQCRSYKKGLSGETVMIGRLYATQGGAAQYFLDAAPVPRFIPIHDAFRSPCGAGEPTF